MRSQQQAEKAEQQRIKNLVLNYDLTDDQPDGGLPAFHYVNSSGGTRLVGTGQLNKSLKAPRGPSQRSTATSNGEQATLVNPSAKQSDRRDSFTDETGQFENLHGGPRYDKAGNTRSKQRARKLQLGDIDWCDKPPPTATDASRREGESSLDQYIVDKKKQSTRGGRRGGSGTRGRGGSRNFTG